LIVDEGQFWRASSNGGAKIVEDNQQTVFISGSWIKTPEE
jgi:hypothetical protein